MGDTAFARSESSASIIGDNQCCNTIQRKILLHNTLLRWPWNNNKAQQNHLHAQVVNSHSDKYTIWINTIILYTQLVKIEVVRLRVNNMHFKYSRRCKGETRVDKMGMHKIAQKENKWEIISDKYIIWISTIILYTQLNKLSYSQLMSSLCNSHYRTYHILLALTKQLV